MRCVLVVSGLLLVVPSARADVALPQKGAPAWITECVTALRKAVDELRKTTPALANGEVSYSLDSKKPYREGKVRYVGKDGRVRYDAFIFTGTGAHALGAKWKKLEDGDDRHSFMLQGANQSEAWLTAQGVSAAQFAAFDAAFRPALDRCFELRPRQ